MICRLIEEGIVSGHAPLLGFLLSALCAGALHAQPAPAVPGEGDRNARRLFVRFVEDAAVVPGGWVEGQYLYQNLEAGSRHFAGPLIAFKVVEGVEAGLRFGYVDLRGGQGPDGAGLSDIDLFLKYRLPGKGASRVAIGALLKAPSADEAEGLGTGEPDLEGFVAWRADLEAVTLVASAGARFNGQPDPAFIDTEDSVLLGAAVLLPATERVTFSVEGTYETERLEGDDADGRLTLGLQAFSRRRQGGFRGAVTLPLTDGAPDTELFLGAYLTY
jgi:hypothetical protein